MAKNPMSGIRKTSDRKDVGVSVMRHTSHASIKKLPGDNRVVHSAQPMNLGGNKSGKVAPSVGQSAKNC